MGKRIKRLEKGIESLKQEIEKHFLKIENDLKQGEMDRGRYHIKELDKSLIFALEMKLKNIERGNESAIQLRKRLKKLKEDFGLKLN